MKVKYIIAFVLFLNCVAFADTSESRFSNLFCQGDCEKQLMTPYDPSGPLSSVEQYLIEQYTQTYSILNDWMFANAISKIPKSTLTVYRGAHTGEYKINSVGQVVQANGIKSVSADRSVARRFIKNQLQIIKTKSAHNISSYSTLDEKEYLLLPGTHLRVDKISTETMDLFGSVRNIEVIELTEL